MLNSNINNYYFETYLTANLNWGVRFKAPNNQIIFWSEGYTTKQNAQHAINLCKQFAAGAQIKEKSFA